MYSVLLGEIVDVFQVNVKGVVNGGVLDEFIEIS
jgi:hypothetical protein